MLEQNKLFLVLALGVVVAGAVVFGAGGEGRGLSAAWAQATTQPGHAAPAQGPGGEGTDFLTWYESLTKPPWTPDPDTIGLIWLILYPIIIGSFGFVFYKAFRGEVSWGAEVPFIINLIANIFFMSLFEERRRLPLAAADIVVVLVTIPWMMAVTWRRYRWVALAQVPYLVWVGLCTVMQLAITLENG